MKKILTIAAVAGAMLASAAPADARQGCGPGFHRGPRGHCIGNRAGGFYRGRGYWDGHRYWNSRYRDHGGWRYR